MPVFGEGVNPRRRFILLAVVLVAFSVEAVKAAREQLVEYDEYQEKVVRNTIRVREANPFRGALMDRNLETLAVSVDVDSVFAVPRAITDKRFFAGAVASMLDLDEEEVFRKIDNDLKFRFLKRKISHEESRRIRKAKQELVGLHVLDTPEKKRFYPNRELAGQLLGFVNFSQVGSAGLEQHFDRTLRGEGRKFYMAVSPKRARRRILPEGLESTVPTASSVVLTIDATLQAEVEQILTETVLLNKAEGGMILVSDVETGEILASANYPFLNPNSYTRYDKALWRNRVMTDLIEPGSTMKPISYAIVHDMGLVKAHEWFDTPRLIKVGRNRIKDIHHEPRQTAEQIIVNSSNVGTAKMAWRVKDESRFYDALKRFGFGAKLGVDFPAEGAGILSDPSKRRWGLFKHASVAFGQGVSVTTLQLHYALAALANDGVLMRPRLVRAVVDGQGEVARRYEPEAIRRVVSERSASMALDAMEKVVSAEGTGGLASLDMYRVCGKTGTAQIPGKGGYLQGVWNTLFHGSFPRQDPKYAITVVIEKPRHRIYGGTVAAPAFRRVAERLIQRRGFYPVDRKLARERLEAALGRAATARTDDDFDGAPIAGMGLIPDFRGLTLRESMRVAKRMNVRLDPIGEGRVVEQSILPYVDVPAQTVVSVVFERIR
jgi:cell division protein FtsI (penicillin-binding protein 3)